MEEDKKKNEENTGKEAPKAQEEKSAGQPEQAQKEQLKVFSKFFFSKDLF